MYACKNSKPQGLEEHLKQQLSKTSCRMARHTSTIEGGDETRYVRDMSPMLHAALKLRLPQMLKSSMSNSKKVREGKVLPKVTSALTE